MTHSTNTATNQTNAAPNLGENRAVGLPHHRRPLKKSRRLLKFYAISGAIVSAVVLAVVIKAIF